MKDRSETGAALSCAQAARMLHLTEPTLKRWARQGRLQYSSGDVGRDIYFRREDLLEFLRPGKRIP